MDDDDSDRNLDALLDHLHARVAATAEHPIPESANRWLGEAEAVAADAARGDPPPEAVEKRVRQVRRLLGEVDETGNETVDEHVEAALGLAEQALRALDAGME